jgi:aminoglycoside 2'-N-acetyltransferase I
MDDNNLAIECASTDELARQDYSAIVAMCESAYEEPLAWLFDLYIPATHLIGRCDGQIVSHVMWVTRWLQPEGLRPLRTAYIEMVGTDPQYQSRGYATQLMAQVPERLASDFEFAALSPAETTLYLRLGWVYWRGPRYIRQGEGLMSTPEEQIMVLSLPGTPALNLDAAISAEWREGEVW